MKLISWNINGIRAIVKKDFTQSIEKIDPDILCLQETKAQEEEVRQALSALSEYHIYVNSAKVKGYSGVVLLSKQLPLSVVNDMGVEAHDQEGRVICAEYPDFYLVTVYIPNSGQELKRLDYRKQWDTDFLKYLRALDQSKPLIVCGDFNVAHRAIDLKNDKANYNKTAGYTQTEIDGMDHLLAAGFVDTFRHLHPDEVAYTYWSYRFKARERNTGWRIDYFLTSQSFLNKVTSAKIYPAYFGSDHCPIGIEIEV